MSVPHVKSRVCSSTDAAETAGLLDRSRRELDEYTPGAEVLAERAREHITCGLSVFVLTGPPRTGVAQLRFRAGLYTGKPLCTLEELYVVPESRGLGLGRAVLEAALELARERGAGTMELGTAVGDTAARGFYESLGYTDLEKPGRPGTRMLCYERELGGDAEGR
ncbi:GNAT superfamily N-acetyltransferase [Actinopolyspora biskrensis]|uniref:GNAT superfamily N-acetyltransferase n=1 Tax=Actinopolyspora biskrensis TaxID=1470178 RepID=A0A852YUN4_9ACTN|nr:GNAT family N-acetyltransferase [Actinopolyspora biskrensis]NYH77688.1 GNAT superfamily N-acetyltransferase [Actinopolyspora biskrensis]